MLIGNFSLYRLSQYKDIILYRTWAQLKSESKQYYLGYIWFLLEPLISSLTLYFVFGVLQGNRTQEFIFMLIYSLTLWQWIESSINDSVISINAKLGILTQIPLPKFLFPIVHILASAIKFILVYGVIILIASFCKYTPSIYILFFPIILFITLLLILGISLPLAILNTYFPDTQKVLGTLLKLLFFISGIFFTIDKIPYQLRFYFFLNPFAGLIQAIRDISLFQRLPNFIHLSYALIFGIISCILGLIYCSYIDKKLLKHVQIK